MLPFETPLATILTMIEVDPADPAFADPTKFVGPVYDEAEARALAAEKGWVVKPDGAKFRRVVASPRPRRIFELRPIRWLLEQGTVVICAGGGGIPTMYAPDEERTLVGVEAVDRQGPRERAARARARRGRVHHGDRRRRRVRGLGHAGPATDRPELTADDAGDARRSPAGSMGPKVEAAAEFAAQTGKRAAIGSLDQIDGLVDGTAGTNVVA